MIFGHMEDHLSVPGNIPLIVPLFFTRSLYMIAPFETLSERTFFNFEPLLSKTDSLFCRYDVPTTARMWVQPPPPAFVRLGFVAFSPYPSLSRVFIASGPPNP